MRTEEALLLLRGDGTIAWANDAAAGLLGYSPSELLELALPLVAPAGSPADAPTGPVARGFRAIISGEAVEAEGNARFPDKENKRVAVYWKLWALPIPSGEGKVLLSLSETAQASKDGPITSGYRDVFEFSVEGIFRSTADGRLIEANPALARLYGYRSPAEMMTAITDITTQLYRDPKRRLEFVRQMLYYGAVSGFESEVYRADGSLIWIAVFARTVRDSSGQPLYFEGSAVDITKRKRAEESLKQSEERFRQLVESTHVVPFEFDPPTAKFTYFGPQAEVLLGHDLRKGLTIEDWASIVHPEDVNESLRFATESGSIASHDFHTEFRISSSDGRTVWIKQLVHRASGESGSGRVHGFLIDVTDSKKIEEERERSREKLREFAERCQQVREEERLNVGREIHDELGQALTLFRIDLAWLAGRIARMEPVEERILIGDKVAATEKMLDSTLQTMRRILAALRPPLLSELGLKDAIEFHVEEFCKRLGIRSEVDLVPVLGLPESFAIAVFRIFQEILTNVARHAKASRIKVTLSVANGQLVMSVEDNGVGITKDKFTKFKCFGLLGIQERAVFMGGEVEIHGSPRTGTTVVLRVPIGEPSPAPPLPQLAPV